MIFGMKEKTIAGIAFDGDKCRNCFNKQYLSFAVIKYFHLYWIPTFPTKKSVGLQCVHCRTAIKDRELPVDLATQLKSSFFTRKRILPLFSGTAVVACVLLVGLFTAWRASVADAQYIQQPTIDDLYVTDFGEVFEDDIGALKYGVMRVAAVANDQVEFEVGKVVYLTSSSAKKDIRNDATARTSYYSGERINIDMNRLRNLDEAGAISSIHRD